ncbi:sigma-70 family RNA polymerase sigma factor [Herbaspirillum lusitanum]|jgi:RNA polymerase sigma-70 factor (ECF subfamily)|uniref:Sigma-70 family RNA polymerase sigma factor n=1 Tax=Herbaspirillum lusitanum TaxID=213312 RepID=A0ABW9A474_9BURK
MPFANTSTQQDFHALYSDHHGWLVKWLRWRLGNAADAADLAQDAFVRLIVKSEPASFATPVQARAYLRAMAQGMCSDLWRRREIEQAWLDALAVQPQAHMPSPEHCAIVVETLMEISAVMDRLPGKVCKAFVMAQIQGLPTSEIATALEVSVRMVQKYLAQAMLQLALVDAGLRS